jgi:hypothetical protein
MWFGLGCNTHETIAARAELRLQIETIAIFFSLRLSFHHTSLQEQSAAKRWNESKTYMRTFASFRAAVLSHESESVKPLLDVTPF